jgi:hypothetical protein
MPLEMGRLILVVSGNILVNRYDDSNDYWGQDEGPIVKPKLFDLFFHTTFSFFEG